MVQCSICLKCLPATSFTRQDYAELFPVQPADEFGRDDAGKFAVSIVEVKAGRVELHVHNTHGRQGRYVGEPLQAPPRRDLIPHLRHSPHHAKALPFNGPMEEFDRKLARNDYPFLRLMQLGIDTIRVPSTDLLDPLARQRLEDWVALNRKIVAFWTGGADAQIIEAAQSFGDGLRAFEVVQRQPSMTSLSGFGGLPLWVSKITTSADKLNPDEVFSHSVNSGALVSNLEEVAQLAAQLGAEAVVMLVPWEAEFASSIGQALQAIEGKPLKLVLNLSLRHGNPALANFDFDKICARIEQAETLVRSNPKCIVQLDTFEDVDRGYGPRFGLIDRFSNIREKNHI